MLKSLKDRNELVRVNSVETIGYIGDAATIPFIKRALRDPSPLVRRYAALALASFGPAQLKALQTHLSRERSQSARLGCYVGLHLLGDRNALDRLLLLLNSRQYRVRSAAANALAELSLGASERRKVLGALRIALARESTRAAGSSIESSLRIMSRR